MQLVIPRHGVPLATKETEEVCLSESAGTVAEVTIPCLEWEGILAGTQEIPPSVFALLLVAAWDEPIGRPQSEGGPEQVLAYFGGDRGWEVLVMGDRGKPVWIGVDGFTVGAEPNPAKPLIYAALPVPRPRRGLGGPDFERLVERCMPFGRSELKGE